MKSHIELIAIAVLFLQGCTINEQYQLSEHERIQRYLDSNLGTIKRVRDTSFLLFIESKPEMDSKLWEIINQLKKEVMHENTSGSLPLSCRELSKELLELIEFVESEGPPLSDVEREEITVSFIEVVNKILDPSLPDDEQKKNLISFAIDNVWPVAQRNEIEEYIKESFFGGYVICGMNKDDVLVIKGRPDSKYESIDSAFRRYSRWSYDNYGDSQNITFTNDVVDDISTFEHRYRY